MPMRMTASLRARIHGGLRRRQRTRVLSRTLPLRGAMERLAARALMPARSRGLSFDDGPIQPLERVRLVVLSRILHVNEGGAWGEVVFTRAYGSRLDPGAGVLRWDEDTALCAGDLNRPFTDHGSRWALSLQDWPLCRVALDLDRATEVLSDWPFRVSGPPTLPPVLLAVPVDTVVEPEQTSAANIYAFNYGVPWQEAWQRLREEWRVPQELVPTGLELVDLRLAPGLIRKSVGEFLDLRDALGYCTHNPVRDGGLPRWFEPRHVVAALRHRLAPELALAVTDEDLLRAAADPYAPLVVTGMPRAQVWRPPSVDRDGFVFQDEAHACNLWDTGQPRRLAEEREARASTAAVGVTAQPCALAG